MTHYAWETIDSFQSYADFENFLIWIEKQIQLGQAEDVPVQRHFMDMTCLEERWIRYICHDQIWRIVWPDPPFKGFFEPVEDSPVLV